MQCGILSLNNFWHGVSCYNDARARRKMLHQALRVSYNILFDPGRDTLNPAASSTFVTCATRTYPSDLCIRGDCVPLARIKRVSRERAREFYWGKQEATIFLCWTEHLDLMGNLHASTSRKVRKDARLPGSIITINCDLSALSPHRWTIHKAILAIGERTAAAEPCIKCIDSFDLPAQTRDGNKSIVNTRSHRCEIKKYALRTIMSDDYCFWNLYASEAFQEFCISIYDRVDTIPPFSSAIVFFLYLMAFLFSSINGPHHKWICKNCNYVAKQSMLINERCWSWPVTLLSLHCSFQQENLWHAAIEVKFNNSHKTVS